MRPSTRLASQERELASGLSTPYKNDSGSRSYYSIARTFQMGRPITTPSSSRRNEYMNTLSAEKSRPELKFHISNRTEQVALSPNPDSGRRSANSCQPQTINFPLSPVMAEKGILFGYPHIQYTKLITLKKPLQSTPTTKSPDLRNERTVYKDLSGTPVENWVLQTDNIVKAQNFADFQIKDIKDELEQKSFSKPASANNISSQRDKNTSREESGNSSNRDGRKSAKDKFNSYKNMFSINTTYEQKFSTGNKVETGNWMQKRDKKETPAISNFTLLMKNKLGLKGTPSSPLEQNTIPTEPSEAIIRKEDPSPLRNEKTNKFHRINDGFRGQEKENIQNLANKDSSGLEAYVTQVSRQDLAFVANNNKGGSVYAREDKASTASSRWSDIDTTNNIINIPDTQINKTTLCFQNNTYFMTKFLKAHEPSLPKDYFSNLFREQFLQTFHSLRFINQKRGNYERALADRKVELKNKNFAKGKKSLVFDLDETLIHCNESMTAPYDVSLSVRFPNGDTIEARINIRPHLVECLRELSRDFEIIVFTASHSCYANRVLDYLDPKGEIFHHRFFREHCILTNEGIYIKDLRIFSNRNLADIALIDNACYSFANQLDNGVPILPFYESKRDTELKDLVPFLKSYLFNDICQLNRKTFMLHKIFSCDTAEKAVWELTQPN